MPSRVQPNPTPLPHPTSGVSPPHLTKHKHLTTLTGKASIRMAIVYRELAYDMRLAVTEGNVDLSKTPAVEGIDKRLFGSGAHKRLQRGACEASLKTIQRIEEVSANAACAGRDMAR